MPWDFRVYVNKEKCKEKTLSSPPSKQGDDRRIQTSIPLDCKVVVAVDGGLCVKRVIRAVDESNFDLVGRVRKGRKFNDERNLSEVKSCTVGKLKGLDIPSKLWADTWKAKDKS